MIAKTTIGSTISSALAYGAGELGERSRHQKAEKVDLLATYNLSAQPGDTPKQVHGEIADEMKAVVRDHPGRCKNPVWHTSLSLPANETLDVQAWTKAVDIYLKTVGIDTAQHQVAVFRHRDTAHDHVHIYANRIAMDGGAAVETGWNYALNVKATRQIEQELDLTPLTKESKRTSLKDHDPGKQVAREVVAQALKNVLQRDKPTNLDELVSDLEKHRITAKIASNVNGPYGISFQAEGHQAVKGIAAGYKFNQLAVLLEANRAEYQAEINRLQQERDQAEKSRESEEKARKQAEQERDQAFNQAPQVTIQEVVKPDPADKARIEQLEREKQTISSAKAEAEKARQIEEKARQQAERERDQARKQSAKVEIREKEVITSDPRDKARIQELEKENQTLTRRLQLSKQLEVIKGVSTTPMQRAALLNGQKVLLLGLKGTTDTFDAYVSIEMNKLAFRRISALVPLPPKPAVVPERPAPHPTPEVPQAAPIQKLLSPELPVLDSAVVEKMRQIMIKAAKKSKTWDGFSATLRLEGVKRQKLETGKFSYTYKNVQATAAELGFKTGEIKALIEQRTPKIGR